MQKVLMIDDDQAFLDYIEGYVNERYPSLEFTTCLDPVRGLAAIHADLSLLLLDLEMPGLDGGKLLTYAVEKGVRRNRIIILSGRDAEYLHKRFPMGSCLAVLNKHEVRQKAVLDMVFSSLQGKCLAKTAEM
ncbi:response regulator [Trichloromonas sp.]|uniref:response regulator n=1 Tax=Trichloromonas sp. TaxID=3069249 RepID=UPI003D81BD1C